MVSRLPPGHVHNYGFLLAYSPYIIVPILNNKYFFIKRIGNKKVSKKSKKKNGRSGPTKNTRPKAQAPTAQKAGTGLTASQCSSGGQPENPRPPTCAACSARATWILLILATRSSPRRLYHGALSAFVSLYHGALSARRSRSSSSSSCLRHPPHRRTPPTSARPPLAITPPRKRRTTASALRAPSCTEDIHYDRYISRQANICGDRQDPLRSRLSR